MNLNRMLQGDVPYEEFHDASMYTASEAFIESMQAMVKEDDLLKMREAQCHMLLRFEKTNEMLQTFLTLSASRYQATVEEFQNHTVVVTDMKKDLDSIFRRIRMLKRKLGKQYPGAFAACSDVHDLQVLEEDEEAAAKEQAVAPSNKPTKPPARPPAPTRPPAPDSASIERRSLASTSSSNSVDKISVDSRQDGQTDSFESKSDNNSGIQQTDKSDNKSGSQQTDNNEVVAD